MTTRLSLAEQIALLEEPAPVDLDPEGAHVLDIENEINVEPLARAHYVDVGPGLLQKQHDSFSDPKYESVSVTRKDMVRENSGEDMHHDSDVESGEVNAVEPEENRLRSPVKAQGQHSDEGNSSSSEEERGTPALAPRNSISRERQRSEHESTEDLSVELRKRGLEDRRKGMAVSRQLALWDTLLDARIRIQKAVAGSNRLPPPLDVKECLTSADCKDSVDKLLKETALLSNEILQLQEYLFESNDTLTAPPPKRRKIEAGGNMELDYEQWLEDATEDASSLEKFYHPYLIQTLAKWSSKIQAVSPSVLLPSNRNAFLSRRSQHTKGVLEVIDEATADVNKLLARTQVRRTTGARIGVTETAGENEEEDPNIFDDTDFYQQMLRDLIDTRANTSGGGDWMTTQRQKKAKKTVDTKASKGRKLRYETHEKIQNFMVPTPVVGGWHEEQIDELFASLLGKGFNVPVPEIAVEGVWQEAAALKDGFRVFG